MGRARSVAATAGVLVVAVALVVLAGFAGAGYYNLSTAEAAQLSRTQLRQLAFDAVPKVFGFDYQTVEASMTEAEGLLTPAYRTEFAERAKTDIIPAALTGVTWTASFVDTGSTGTAWGQIMAYASMITVPVLVLFIAFQRAFINSIASSGVKG